MTNAYSWYSQLAKPFWAPPSWVFGPVWSVLYVLIAISFGKVFLLAYDRRIPFIVVLPFILNLIFNFSFVPIQFMLRDNLLASIDVVLVLITLIWAIVKIYPYNSGVAYMQVPYLLWVIFATGLQISITILNM